MPNNNQSVKLIKKMLNKYPHLPNALKYEYVAEDLGVSSRLVRYIEKGRVPPKPVEKLMQILAR